MSIERSSPAWSRASRTESTKQAISDFLQDQPDTAFHVIEIAEGVSETTLAPSLSDTAGRSTAAGSDEPSSTEAAGSPTDRLDRELTVLFIKSLLSQLVDEGVVIAKLVPDADVDIQVGGQHHAFYAWTG